MSAARELPSSFDGIAAIAWTLAPPGPGEKKDVLRDEAGFLLDGLLVRVARSQGALDVAIGELLADVGTGDRALRLGFSRVGDYARERLGIAASTAQKLVRLAIGLRDRPLLREAVRSGEVTARKAETILRVARGDDEAGWVARAKIETVRSLKAAVLAALGDGSGPEVLALTRIRGNLNLPVTSASSSGGWRSPPWRSRPRASCSSPPRC